jgi:uncharacterized protein YjbI with pentapeptide repeats
MDHGAFDRLARLLGAAGSRRAALGALLGTGFAGRLSAPEAAQKNRNRNGNKNRKNGKKGKAQVSAQAAPDCASPGVGSNISGCPYQNQDFSGDNISSSRMVDTNFRNAELSSSNAKGAIFREANLACANLSSSQLRNADFRGSAGNPTNLFGANLASSGCAGIQFNQFTLFCGTRTCNGTLRNDDCGSTDPETVCDGGGTLPLQSPCTATAECAQTGTGAVVCEDVPFCGGTLVPQCCRETGGSCSEDCDCCDFDLCNGNICG